VCGKAEDAGGLTPVKDDNAVHTLFEPLNFTDSQALRLYGGRGTGKEPLAPAGALGYNIPKIGKGRGGLL